MNETNNIPNDFENLEKYAPALAKVKKENCFKVPDGYFDELPQAVRAEIIVSQFSKQNPFSVPDSYFDELPKEIESGIIASSFPKENPFEMPAGYFESLPVAISERIETPTKKVKVLRLDWFNKTQLIAAAASLFIVCLIGIKYWKQSNQLSISKDVASVTKPVEKTLDERVENMDESTLEEALSEETGADNSQLAIAGSSSNDDIVNYLIDNHIDTHTLMNELKEK